MNEKYEWKLTALAPDTADEIRKKIMPAIEASLRESGHGDLLDSKEITVDRKENFPHLDHQTVIMLVQFGTKVAYDVFKAYALPKLRKLAEVREGKRKAKEPQSE